ncbi:MAG: carbohydrate kinase family protein [Clostridiales bacterium]|nr:carbohydrate kinase family protein [Clostridiales bacterium]
MSFIAGFAAANVDLLYEDMPRLPEPGEEIYTNRFSLQLGGGLAATLINLGRLGVPARIATELGDDMFSDFARSQFEKNGVQPLNLYHGDKIPVNITSAVILPGDRSFISYGKGDARPDDEAKNAFYETAKGAKICLMTPGGFEDVYRKLKSEGTVTVLDMGWDDELGFDKYGELFEIADYYTPNRKEAEKLTGKSDPRDAAEALKKYFKNVVVKADKDGCYGIDETGLFFCPAVEEFRHVDSTGAGDAFLAGFCYGLYHGCSLRDCIEFGNITGGKAVTAVGALSAYVTEDELLAYKARTGKNE